MRLAKLNPGFVMLDVTVQISKALHDGKTLLLNNSLGHLITLPAAVGSGCKLRFLEISVSTANANTIRVQNTIDVMVGSLGVCVAAGTAAVFPTAATSDTITANKTTSGGATPGGHIELEDVRPGVWAVNGVLNGSGAATTPFSATV